MESDLLFRTEAGSQYELRSLASQTGIKHLYSIVKRTPTGESAEFNGVLVNELPLEVGRRVMFLMRERSEHVPAYYLTTPLVSTAMNR